MFLLSKGGSIAARRGEGIESNSHQKSKQNSSCTHFIACAIGANVVGTNAWYLLHLCGGCRAHIGHLLQFFHAFTPFFLWCSTFVSHAFPSSHIQAHNSKHEKNTQLQLLKQ